MENVIDIMDRAVPSPVSLASAIRLWKWKSFFDIADLGSSTRDGDFTISLSHCTELVLFH